MANLKTYRPQTTPDVSPTYTTARLRDLEQFMLGTALRGKAALEAFNNREIKNDGDKLLWSGDKGRAKRLTRAMHDECNAQRLYNGRSSRPWTQEDDAAFK